MNCNKRLRKILSDNKLLLVVILLFLCSTILRGILSDFPKALRIYPDELRYVGIANSLFKGQGLRIHNMDSDFQKILYSICMLPAFFAKSSAAQIRLIGYINSLIVSSSIFPVYALCQKINLKDKDTALMIICWFTLPTLLVSMYFMSEVIYLPLSLCLLYCAWRIFCADEYTSLKVQICLHIFLGMLCYLAYLCKEIALYFILSYLLVRVVRIFVQEAAWKKELLYLITFIAVFALCFLGMKLTVFHGLHNSYSNYNLFNMKDLNILKDLDKLKYLCYAFVYDAVFAIIAMGIFPVLFPLFVFDKNEKESWFYLFLLTAFLIGCAAIACTITLPEELGTRSPRQHIRYLEPFAIPFYILMLNALDRVNFHKVHFKPLITVTSIFLVIFVVMGAGGGSAIVDNNMLIYYEYFARFICKSDILLLMVRILMALMAGIGLLLLGKDKDRFLRVFSVLFIGLNLMNSIAGYFACTYRYTIDEELRKQVSMANDYLWSVPGNILLLTDEGWESEDSRLFDTYVSRDFYVTEMDAIEADGLLEDAVLDLQTESLPCSFPNEYYLGLTEIDYLIVKDDYGIQFQQDSVDRVEDFPLPGYHLYKNRKPEKIYFATASTF